MAIINANTAGSATLTPDTVDTINLTCPATRLIVWNLKHTGSTLYFTFAPAATGAPTPTVGGNNCYAVSHGPAGVLNLPALGVPLQIKVISAAAQDYSVMVV
jgi:hypothetical protein